VLPRPPDEDDDCAPPEEGAPEGNEEPEPLRPDDEDEGMLDELPPELPDEPEEPLEEEDGEELGEEGIEDDDC
jgi:hypothetical protein